MIRVAIVDDHELVRTGLRALLQAESDIEVVAVLDDGAAAVEFVARAPVDVMLMDLAMPGLDGVAATRRVRAVRPDTAVLVLTTFPDDEHIARALHAGAIGYHLKTGSTRSLIAAVRDAHLGRRTYAPEVLDRLTDSFVADGTRRPVDGVPPELEVLTPRELEVFIQAGRGLSNPEIASLLHLSPASVKTYITRILGKLGLTSRVQLVVLAFETGVVTSGGAE